MDDEAEYLIDQNFDREHESPCPSCERLKEQIEGFVEDANEQSGAIITLHGLIEKLKAENAELHAELNLIHSLQ